MIKQLRLKLITILMSIIALILLAIFVSVFSITRNSLERNSDEALQTALHRYTSAKVFLPDEVGKPNEKPTPSNATISIESNPQSPFHFFEFNTPKVNRMPTTVLHLTNDGQIREVENKVSFDDEFSPKEVVSAIQENGSESGELSQFTLRFLTKTMPDGTWIALVDTTMQHNLLNDMLRTSLLLFIAALILFFIISILLANWAVRPVALAWQQQQQFVADASHELKTPLTVILSNTEMLSSQENIGEKNKLRVQYIKEEGLRMKHLVEDLLMLARSDSHNVKSMPVSTVDLSALANNVLLIFEASAYENKITMESTIPEQIMIDADEKKIKQLFEILLDNALKYTPENRNVSLSIIPTKKKRVRIEVFNAGEPIPQADLASIFHRFYRIDKSRQDLGGFGLGLAIAQSIVHDHNGEIWAESNPNGNTFIVELPQI